MGLFEKPVTPLNRLIDVKTISLRDYYAHLKDRQIQSIIFVDTYFQIHFVDGCISCISETFVNTPAGSFIVPSKDGTEITVNTRLGPAGDTFHITVEDLPTLHF